MPTYDYYCAACGPFEKRRPMSEAAANAPCVVCLRPAPRVISAPQLNLMSTANRYAETRNEKSAHEPDVVHTLAPHGHTHASGHSHSHGHSHTHGKSQHRKRVGGNPHRPWMIGH